MGRCSLLPFRLPVEIEYLTVMRDRFAEGADLITALLPDLDAPMRDEAERMVNLGRFIGRCAETTVNVKRWYRLKLRLSSVTSGAELEKIVEEMTAVAHEEIANAEATIPLVQKDSRLGWEPTMEYVCDESHLRWKIRQVRLVLEQELAMHRNALR